MDTIDKIYGISFGVSVMYASYRMHIMDRKIENSKEYKNGYNDGLHHNSENNSKLEAAKKLMDDNTIYDPKMPIFLGNGEHVLRGCDLRMYATPELRYAVGYFEAVCDKEYAIKIDKKNKEEQAIIAKLLPRV